ncbi:hypothetical protein AYL99_04198 [Fonsecaea erecta]|uniref:BZIP domain-containing protein n=1 Tax=Fonsecaea erecta TaxID=1367422 RepID=A0A178ZSL5_9EURO|nr:hypothetical protein AYL99_04198 [Fonsecaea erecta]OAP61995.1 hypothetical protein AYL99_04198 [Fonsecaea erecta]
MDLGFPTNSSPAAYGWSYPSSASSDQSSIDILDFLFHSAPNSPAVHACPLRRESESQQRRQPTLYGDLFSQSPAVDVSVDYASSEQSDDFWTTKEATTTDLADLPSDSTAAQSKTTDRKHRRREQNRKAQSNFRQKRKEEVRRLEQEVEELRAQVAWYHKRGPTVGLTVCTSCRNFFPASSADVVMPHTTDSDFFNSTPPNTCTS